MSDVIPQSKFKYDAFISYSRKDSEFARRLEQALSTYKPPKDLNVPQRHLRVFRDESDFQGVEYHDSLDRNLKEAANLIVICSPNSADSHYVEDEIRRFAEYRSKDHIIPVLIAGVPNNEAKEEEAKIRAFPKELVKLLPIPLASEYRGFNPRTDKVQKGSFTQAWLKTLADLYADYGVDRSQIEQREQKRKARNLRIAVVTVSAVGAALVALTIWALISREEALRQRDFALSRQLAVQARAQGTVQHDLAVLLALAGFETRGTLEARGALLDALTAQPRIVRYFRGRLASSAFAATVSSDGRILATGGCGRYADDQVDCDQGMIQLWDAQTGTPFGEPIAAHRGKVEALAFLPDGKRLASASPDEGGVSLWDVGQRTLSASHKVTDAEKAFHATFSRDGRWVAMGRRDGSVTLWDVQLGQPLINSIPLFRGADAAVAAMEFSPSGHLLVAGSTRGEVRLVRIESRPVLSKPFRAHQNRVDAVAIDPIASRLATSGRDGKIKFWQIHGTELRLVRDLAENAKTLAWSPDGGVLIAAGDYGVKLWSMPELKPLRAPVSNLGGAVLGLRFGASAQTLIAHGERGLAALIDASSDPWRGAILRSELATVEVIDFSRDGTRMASGGCAILLGRRDNAACQAGGFQVWNAQSYDPLGAAVQLGKSPVSALRFGPEVRSLRGASFIEGTVFDWDIEQRDTARNSHLATGVQSISTIELTSDGKAAIVAGCGQFKNADQVYCKDGRLELWDTEPPERVGEPFIGHHGAVAAVALSPDRRWIATGGDDGEIRLWDRLNGKEVGKPIPTKFRDAVTGTVQGVFRLAFSLDSRYLAAGSGEAGDTVILDVANPTNPNVVSRIAIAGVNGMSALVFSPDGRMVATNGAQGEVAVWDPLTGERIMPSLTGPPGPVKVLAFSPDGKRLVAGDEKGVVMMWEVFRESLAEQACRLANRNLTPEEWTRFVGDQSPRSLCPGLP